MTTLSDEEIQLRIERFKKANPPDSVSYLQRLRPAIIRLHIDGYSRRLIFKGLTDEGLISCSQSAFYRWLAANVDLDFEARELVEKSAARAGEGGGLDRAPEAAAGRETAAQQKQGVAAGASASAPREAVQAPLPKAGNTAKPRVTKDSTVSTTVESISDTTVSTTDDDRRRLLSMLDSTLQGMESQAMGAVSDRAHARLKERDQGRGGRDG